MEKREEILRAENLEPSMIDFRFSLSDDPNIFSLWLQDMERCGKILKGENLESAMMDFRFPRCDYPNIIAVRT